MEGRVQVHEFMHDLIACRDQYIRDCRCILPRHKMCDISNYFAVNWSSCVWV